MKKTSTLLGLLCLFFTLARAAYVPVPITSGFNADVVANGIGSPAASSTGSLDAVNYVFVAQDYQYNSGCALPTSPRFLPTGGVVTNLLTTGPQTYQLADYNANNSLSLDATTPMGTLVLATPVSAAELYLLANSGSGASTVAVTVNFTDLTSQVFPTVAIADWYGGANAVIRAARVATTTTGCGTDFTALGPNLYQYVLNIDPANYSKQIASVQVTRLPTSTGKVNLMAMSANTPCVAPVDQASSLVLTPTTSQISGSYTGAASSPTGYLVVRYPSGSIPVAPANGTVYTTGQNIGTGTVVYEGPGWNFTAYGLTPATAYDVYVYAYNNTTCGGGPAYNVTAPLMGTQTTVPCGTGPGNVTIPVGPGQTYTSLTAAVNALSTTGITGAVTIELQPGYNDSTEPAFPIVFPTNPCIGANYLTVRPAAGANNLVIGDSVNNNPIIDLNGATHIIIDGRPGGTSMTGRLQIINTSPSGVAVRLTNDASGNTLRYLDLQGQNTGNTSSSLTGVVYIGTAGFSGTGNDSNRITHNNIHATASGNPAMGISASGTTTNANSYNEGNVIDSNNIYDYFHPSLSSVGVKLDQGNSAWTVSNNHLYQTAPRVYTANVAHRALWINPNGSSLATMTPEGSGFQILNNTIGGSAPNAGGTPYTMSGSTATTAPTYMGMDISVGVGNPTVVQGNTIKNINFSSASTASPNFTGILQNYGVVNILSNVIGDSAANGSIALTRTGTSTTAGTAMGIRVNNGATATNVLNNVIGGITSTGTATVPYSITGISLGNGSFVVITDNLIGSNTAANSINASSSTSGAQVVMGINVTGGTQAVMANNTIANLNNNAATSATGAVRGIVVGGSQVGIIGNTIYNLSTSATNTNSGVGAGTIGISMNSTLGGHMISNNNIYNLKSTAASSNVNVLGMYIGGATTSSNTISKNTINRLSATTSAPGAFITGIDVGAGYVDVVNNMISLGTDDQQNSITTPLTVRGITRGSTATASRFAHNSVYIGGNNIGTTATTKTFAFQRNSVPATGMDTIVNNVFVNARSNAATGGGNHYAILLNSSSNNLYANNNVYYVTGTDGLFANNSGVDHATYTPGWIASDMNSLEANPQFMDPIGTLGAPNLHISPGAPTPVESNGTPLVFVTDDFDGELRALLTPVDIGADAGAFTPLAIKLLSFTGQNAGSVNKLFWTSSDEARGDLYSIQRSTDGADFTTIGFIDAKGEASGYTFTDHQPVKGINHYRLELKDAGGAIEYSRTVSLMVKDLNIQTISVYPNPASDVLHISITGAISNNDMFAISDITGKVIHSQPVSNNILSVDLSGFSKGVYFFSFTHQQRQEVIKFTVK